MAQDIGAKISVDGEKQFKDSIKNIVAETKSLNSEMKLLESSFDETTSEEEKMQKKSELLNKQIEAQQKYVDKLSEGLSKATEEYGEGSTEVYNYQDKVNKARSVLNGMTSQLKNMEGGVDDTTEAMEEGEDQSSRFADTLKANLLSEAITKGFEALASAAKKVTDKLKESVLESAAYADNFNTLSVTTGLSTDTLQEYAYMADLADVSLDTVTGSLTKLTKTMKSASDGNETASAKFEALGISVTDTNGNLRSSEEVFNEALEALSGIENQTERDATAMELFGKSAQDLNPLMAIGADGINQLKQEAHDTGYVLDTEALTSLNSVQDAMDRWKNTTTTLSNEIGLKLAPYVSQAVDAVNQFFAEGGLEKIIDAFKKWSPLIAGVVAGLVAFKVAMGIGSLIDGVRNAITSWQTATEGMTAAQAILNTVMNANPIALVTMLIAGLVTAFATAYATSETFRNKVNNAFNTAKGAVVGAWNAIQGAWSSATSFFGGIVSSIKSIFDNLVKNALTWGKDMISNLISGITSKVSGVVSAVSGVAGKIASFLHFSEPDVGPLSNFNSWMPDMMSQMAEQIERGRGMVQNAVRNVASDIALPIGSANTLNYGGTTINVYGAEGQSVDALAEIIQQKLDDDVRRKGAVFA